MFGISGAEFLIIIIVAAAVIPAKNWPDVARALARVVKTIREIIWKITDATEEIKEQIEREAPIDKLTQQTMDDVMSVFATRKVGTRCRRVQNEKGRAGSASLPIKRKK